MAGLGTRVGTDRAEPPCTTSAPWPGSRAHRRGTRTSPSRPWRREGALGGSPTTGHSEASSSLCRFPLFLPPVWLLAAEPRQRLGRAVPEKGCQASAAPCGPPAPHAKAGGWQKGCLCLAGLRQLREDPCATLAANFPASWHRRRLRRHWQRRLGRTDCERERGGKKKKKKMDTCHRWSGKAAAAKTPAGSAGPKPTGGREEGLAARPGAGHMEDRQRGRGTAWPRQDE